MSDRSPVLRERYALGPQLGGGDGSATYLAEDLETGDRCVVKTLSVGEVVREGGQTHSFDPDDFTKLIELFEREARVLAHLDHSGIPRFIDHFTESVDGDTRLYTVQEYVEGKTLQALVEEGKHFTEAEAKDVCRQVAEILQHLHGRSPPLIHRDIKPTNVILDDGGTVHLVDFGSVRNAIGADGLDGKTIVGTYGYMPIEQYEARAVPQSDFYALGMTLVFVLSQREPTQIPRRGMTLAFGEYVNVSSDFARVIARMIEAAPEDRFTSAHELLAALERPWDDAVALAPPTARTAVARRRALAMSTALALVALLGLLGSLLWQTGPPMPVAGVPPTIGVTPPLPSEPRPLVGPVDGVISVNLDQDFTYEPTGFPMGRAVGQTSLPPLTSAPSESLKIAEEWQTAGLDLHYGYFPLGNGTDRRIAFALGRRDGTWFLMVDSNNDEDLTNDGPSGGNEGTGDVMAREVFAEVEVTDMSGATLIRPYHMWVFFNESNGGIRGSFYARNHYRGEVSDGRVSYPGIAFEDRDHDGLYRDSGLCIDLNRDAECGEDGELFRAGAMVRFPGGSYRLALDYP